MDVKQIVKEYLIEYDYSGLVSEENECGCELDDLFPCERDSIASCQPGYRHTCRGPGKEGDCEEECELGPSEMMGGFCVTKEKKTVF